MKSQMLRGLSFAGQSQHQYMNDRSIKNAWIDDRPNYNKNLLPSTTDKETALYKKKEALRRKLMTMMRYFKVKMVLKNKACSKPRESVREEIERLLRCCW